ncbi:MAG: holliday junction helicase RuvA [Candidatus Sumerlaeota bacterium]|nr:holliday junction helicase RuvA [Candidatus Sumerlaeota bacterium]
MLHSLQGKLLEADEDHAVVDVGGLRFRVEIPGSTAAQLPKPGEPVELLTNLAFNANDGTFSLFGFRTSMERDCFDVLLGMSGIGPRKALMMLSQIEIGAFARAIVAGDLAYVSSIKGVGKKTAERLLVELREKMAVFVGTSPAEAAFVPLAGRENITDAIKALMALGTRPAVAEKAVRSAVEALGEEASTEDLVREGLKRR